MNVIRDGAYWAKKTLLGLFGPAALDKEHDPIEQLKREHEEDVRADEGHPPPRLNAPRPEV